MTGDESSRRKNARSLLVKSGYRAGGSLSAREDAAADKKMIEKAVHEHERQDHPGKPLSRLHLAAGGPVDGDTPPARGDRGSRGGKGKGAPRNHIAIIVAPPGGGAPAGAAGGGNPGVAGPPPMPPPHPPMAGPPPGMPPGAGGMPPPGMMPPPGAMGPPGMPPRPGMPGPGMPPPMMHKRGGRTHATSIADDMPMPSGDPRKPETASAQGEDFLPGEKRGGRAHHARGGEVGPGRIAMEAGAGSGEGRLEKARASR
jgi:hypothetical protein